MKPVSSKTPSLPGAIVPIDLHLIWSLLTHANHEATLASLRQMMADRFGRNPDLDASVAAVIGALDRTKIRLSKTDSTLVRSDLMYAAIRVLLMGYGLTSVAANEDGGALLALAMQPHWVKRWGTLTFDTAIEVLWNLLSPRQMLWVIANLFESSERMRGFAQPVRDSALAGTPLVLDDAASKSIRWVIEGYLQSAARGWIGDFQGSAQQFQNALVDLSQGQTLTKDAKRSFVVDLNLVIEGSGSVGSGAALRSATPREWITLARSTPK